jgi:hypothetical protein
MERAISFDGFTPVPSSYDMGALLPDKTSRLPIRIAKK